MSKYQPFFDRRADIISGKTKPTAAEITAGEEVSAKDEDEYTKLPKESDATAPIPEFWLTALRNHPGISELITDRDAEAIKHLTDVKVTYGAPDGRLGFTLTFCFEANEYFENETLTKSYIYKATNLLISRVANAYLHLFTRTRLATVVTLCMTVQSAVR